MYDTAVSVFYQNNVTGDAHDITTLVISAKWVTKRSGSPASLELTMLVTAEVQWNPGGIVTLMKVSGEGLFYGYVVKISQSEKEQVQILAYDQIWYLKKNKDTFVFQNCRADEILSMIASKFHLKTGSLPATEYTIPNMVEDGQTLLDMILKALDYTLINTGKMYVLWDDFGSIQLTDAAASLLEVCIGDESLVTGYTYETDIDSDTYNQIKLVRNNAETGKRDAYLYQDSVNIALWGLLQHYETVEESLHEDYVKTRASQMLKLYNRPKRSFRVQALGDLSVRAGRGIAIVIKELDVNAFFLIEEVSHDLMKETMDITLRVV